MTIADFNLMEQKEQGDLVFNGSFLGERLAGDFKIALYRAEKFYVEVSYHAGRNEIERMEAFDSNERLVPYIEGIGLEKK